jgi:UPF0716 protein FxsA
MLIDEHMALEKIMRILLILFVLVPIIEMWVLIEVGSKIGALPTIGLVLLTACLGLALLRRQGAGALARAQEKLRAQQMPVREMADGLFFAVGGALLLTPGFVTDAIGFACLTPGVRTLLMSAIAKQLVGSGRMHGFNSNVNSGSKSQNDDFFDAQTKPSEVSKTKPNNIIDGDFERDKD